MNGSFNRLAGWSAYVNAAAFLTSLIAVTILLQYRRLLGHP